MQVAAVRDSKPQACRQVACRVVQPARLNGHDPNAYLRDVLQRLRAQLARQVEELLLHRWQGPLATT